MLLAVTSFSALDLINVLAAETQMIGSFTVANLNRNAGDERNATESMGSVCVPREIYLYHLLHHVHPVVTSYEKVCMAYSYAFCATSFN